MLLNYFLKEKSIEKYNYLINMTVEDISQEFWLNNKRNKYDWKIHKSRI